MLVPMVLSLDVRISSLDSWATRWCKPFEVGTPGDGFFSIHGARNKNIVTLSPKELP